MKKLLTLISLLVSVPAFAGNFVTLSWNARPASENVQYYIVSEELSPGRAVLGTTTNTSVILPNVANGQHKYFVSAVNNFGEGIPSGSWSVTVFDYPFGSPGIPSGLNGSVQYTFP